MHRKLKKLGAATSIISLFLLFNLFFNASAESTANNYNEQMKEAKARLLEAIQKETSELSGFDEFATVPITFPIDICLMEVANRLYAACLSIEYYDRTNITVLSVLGHGPMNPENPLLDYELLFKYETKSAQSMDCVSMGTVGYIAIVNDMDSAGHNDVNDGSPVFQLKDNQITPVQYFTKPGQVRVQLVNVHKTLFMIQTYRSTDNNAEKSLCPILKWVDSTFDIFDYLPCMNAIRVESFVIEHHIYIAVANHMDQHQNTETYSTIFRYDMNAHKFNLTQQIKTFGAIDVKHFRINHGALNEHFLIFANRFDTNKQKNSAIASNGVIYRYEHGKFAPIQILNFDSEIEQLLPVLTENKEFVLLVSLDGETMKSYQFDGWKFEETAISFSGGTFGKGISSMRTFNIKKKYTIIVVANTNMYKDAINLFRAKFTVKMAYDFGEAFKLFESWYGITEDKLHADGIVELFEQVEKLQPPTGFGVLNIENSNINIIHTDSMTGTALPINVRNFKSIVEQADKLVAKELLRRPKRLNDSFDVNTTDALSEPLSLSANELTISDSFMVKSVNSHSIDKLLHTDLNLDLDKFVVENLVIAGHTDNFKAIEAKLHEKSRFKREDAINNKGDGSVDLGHVLVDGLVNGIKIEELFKNALVKSAPTQRIEADLSCGSVNAKSLTIPSNHISNVDIDRLVKIVGGSIAIFPPIQFTQPLQVNKLEILERFNHIFVRNKKLDILFKRFGKNAQVITGQKLFQTVNLKEPISLHSNIQVISPVFNRIKPIVTIDDELIIDGPVTFNANTTIKNILSAANIFSPSLHFNVDQLNADGLKVTDQFVDVPIEFVQGIQANNILGQTKLNDIPLTEFIKRDPTVTQEIFGRKIFTSDLTIDGGFVEMNEINGINLQMLNESMFTNASSAQTISGNIAFKRIVADRINFDKIIFGKTPLEKLLTNSTDQVINGSVTIYGNVFVSNASNLNFNHLSMQNRMFDINLEELLNDSYSINENATIHITTNKWFRNLTIERLIVENDFWQMKASTEEIHSRIEELMKNVTQIGPMTYSNQFEIDVLTVNGSINGIPSDKFGTEWLLTYGDQTFLAAQNIPNVDFNHLQTNNYINGVNLDDVMKQTISLKSSEAIHLNNVVFVNVTFEKSIDLRGKLSGIQIPDDLIFYQSNALQNFYEPVVLGGNFNIHGVLTILETLNGRDYTNICDLAQPNPLSDYRLHVEGDLHFSKEPTIVNLNGELFEQMIATSWFLDDQSIEFKFPTHFENVIWQDAVTVSGCVNNVHLEDIATKYMSLSKPQQITTPIKFTGSVHFAGPTNVIAASVDGFLKEYESGITVNLTHFYENVLKNNDKVQTIRAPWTIHEIRSLGSIKDVTLNNLNLITDIVRWNRQEGNIIRAVKTFGTVNINRLYCQFDCTVQGVDITEWFGTSVLNSVDYVIQGTVHLNNAIISHINVVGPVNNAALNSKSTLLKHTPQRIDGSLTIGNSEPVNELRPITFNNIFVGFINDRNFTEFHSNLIEQNRRNSVRADIFTNMQFNNGLTVDHLFTSILQNSSQKISMDNFTINQQNFRMASDELDDIAKRINHMNDRD